MTSRFFSLKSLAFMMELDENLPILDVHGAETGKLSVVLIPCSPAGVEIYGEYVENPDELVISSNGGADLI